MKARDPRAQETQHDGIDRPKMHMHQDDIHNASEIAEITDTETFQVYQVQSIHLSICLAIVSVSEPACFVASV